MKKIFSVLIAVLILAFSAAPALAYSNSSPTASKDFKVIIHNTEGGTGTYTRHVDKDGKHVTVKAHPKKGYEFVKWKIKGKYDPEGGKLTDQELRVLMKSDLEFTPVFRKKGGQSTQPHSSQTPVKSNGSPVSPKTGDNSMFFLFTFIGLACAAVTAVGIKLAVSKE